MTPSQQAAQRISAHLSKQRPDIMPAVWVQEWEKIIREAIEEQMDAVRTAARNRNPDGATIVDFMAVWNEQYQDNLSAIRALAEQYPDEALAKKILEVVGGTEG